MLQPSIVLLGLQQQRGVTEVAAAAGKCMATAFNSNPQFLRGCVFC